MPQKYSTRRTKPSPRLPVIAKKGKPAFDNGGIPIVDISPLLRRDNLRSMQRTLCRIRAAARDTGLFYLAGHGIPLAVLRRAYQCSLQHFELAPEFKIALSTSNGINRYIAERQAFFAQPQFHIVEDGCLPAVIERYYEHIFDLCRSLLEGWAIATGTPADSFHCLGAHPLLYGRLLRPPPSAVESGTDKPGMHQPYGAITILWKDEMDGIRVDDHVIESLSESGRFVFQIADTMARWSTDLHISVPHRLVGGPGRESFSIPVFYCSETNTPIECANSCFLKKSPEQFALVV